MNKEEDSLWKPVISSSLENGQGEEVPFQSLGHEPLKNSSNDVFADDVEPEGVQTTTFSFIKLGKLDKTHSRKKEAQSMRVNVEKNQTKDNVGNVIEKESLILTAPNPQPIMENMSESEESPKLITK